MRYMILAGYTLAAWLLHAVLIQLYINRFVVKSLAFRITHVVEIAIVTSLIMLAYKKMVTQPLTGKQAILIVLATLIILDLVVFIAFAALRQKFDVWHFIAAYFAVVFAVWLSLVK